MALRREPPEEVKGEVTDQALGQLPSPASRYTATRFAGVVQW